MDRLPQQPSASSLFDKISKISDRLEQVNNPFAHHGPDLKPVQMNRAPHHMASPQPEAQTQAQAQAQEEKKQPLIQPWAHLAQG
ncbi:MAG: hypothetical protein SOR40_05455 [Rothia sp. (in: high G+C Gram-positive bacteria)]|nr:hypothetical protein [Rothia sp. (in: high G+C Gram-positive bacteria)]